MTVTDEADLNPRVNLVLNVLEAYVHSFLTCLVLDSLAQRSEGLDYKPIKGLDILPSSKEEPRSSPIPRRKKPAPPIGLVQTNGHTNGKRVESDLDNSAGKKRAFPQALDELPPSAKRSKNQSNGTTQNMDLIIIEDDGAILIND